MIPMAALNVLGAQDLVVGRHVHVGVLHGFGTH